MEVHFCPENNCAKVINEEINNSKNVICAFYDLDLKEINVQNINDLLIDENNFKNVGLEIKHQGLMHNKFCVIDDKK